MVGNKYWPGGEVSEVAEAAKGGCLTTSLGFWIALLILFLLIG